MGLSGSRRATKWVAAAATAALAAGVAYSVITVKRAGQGGSTPPVTAAAVMPASPGCAWPVETTAAAANVAAPDPFAAYWLTPFLASRGESITIRGAFPTSRFMSFAVYNDSFQLFTNSVNGKHVPSYLSSYQITPDQPAGNPWRTGRVRSGQQFTIRLMPVVTAAQQRSENAIPTIDQHAPADTSGPAGAGYVIFRDYLPAGGDAAVQLPSVTVTEGRRSTTLPRCASQSRVTSEAVSDQRTTPASTVASMAAVLDGLRDDGVAMSCTSGCAAPALRYFGPSADSRAGLFPNPLGGYIEMRFTPKPGYVIVTHGKAPTSPTTAGDGSPGSSAGTHPVSWIRPKFQVLYWSIANYLATQPYPVVTAGQGANPQFGATPDYQTTLLNGYYTVVSSLPSDKPSAASLQAAAATWIPMSAANPAAPEFQLLRNLLPQQSLYPQGFAFVKPPADPSDVVLPIKLRQQMGAYYPQTAQCTVRTFQASGWAGCLAATAG
jgi:hypothetical protein